MGGGGLGWLGRGPVRYLARLFQGQPEPGPDQDQNPGQDRKDQLQPGLAADRGAGPREPLEVLLLPQDPVAPHRLLDVLDFFLAQVLEAQAGPVAHLVKGAAGDADAALLGEPLQPGRDVDPGAVDLAPVNQDLAQVQADPELHPLFRGDVGVGFFQPGLDLHGAVQAVPDRGEFGQDVVAGRVHHPAPELLHGPGDDLPGVGDGAEGGLLVLAHEPGVPPPRRRLVWRSGGAGSAPVLEP